MHSTSKSLGVKCQVSSSVWITCFSVLLPTSSALAAHFMSRDALLLVYLLAGLSVFAAALKLRAAFADYFFPVLIGAVALSLFLPGTLMSEYITGTDAHQEFALFQQVAQEGAWRPEVSDLYNAALSVTILPTIISSVSSLDGILIFKIVYPLLFSVVPMILYQIYRKIMRPEAAFVAVFVFLSYEATYGELMQLGRQMVAELIMVLLLWLQLSPTLRKTRASSFLVVLLTLGLVMSHYSLALIYVFLISLSFVASRLSRFRIEPLGSISLLCISLVVSASWFFFVAGGIVLKNLSQVLVAVKSGLSEFFNPATRPFVVIDALGLAGMKPGILHMISRATQYLVVFCIVVGFLVYMHKSMKIRAEKMLTPLMIVSMGFIVASVALPYLAGTLRLPRIYQIALLSISPCFYFGVVKVTKGLQWFCTVVARHPIRIGIGRSVPSAILFSYLIFTSGWVWAIALDTPTSPVLDQERMVMANSRLALAYYAWYTVSEDVAATRWMRTHAASERSICADWSSRYRVLNSYGGYERKGNSLGWASPRCDFARDYVFLSLSNSILGIGDTIVPYGLVIFWLNSTTPTLLDENRVFSDGAVIFQRY